VKYALIMWSASGSKRGIHLAPVASPEERADRMKNFQFESFLASVDLPLLEESVRTSWGWLESIRELRPFALTLAGDVLLIDRSKAIFFLDTNYGVVERIASGIGTLRSRLQHRLFARSILRMDLVLEVRLRRIVAKHNQCYASELSPRVGGLIRADRMRAIDFPVHLEVLALLNERGLLHPEAPGVELTPGRAAHV
jgi:hypothetical protein